MTHVLTDFVAAQAFISAISILSAAASVLLPFSLNLQGEAVWRTIEESLIAS